MLEVPLTWNMLKRAVIAPGKTVKRALQFLRKTRLGTQLSSPVKTDVVKGANIAVILPNQNIGSPGILVDDMVTWIEKVLFAGRKLPNCLNGSAFNRSFAMVCA